MFACVCAYVRVLVLTCVCACDRACVLECLFVSESVRSSVVCAIAFAFVLACMHT